MRVLEGRDADPLVLALLNPAAKRDHPERIKRSVSFSQMCRLIRGLTGAKGAKKLPGDIFELAMFSQLGLDENKFRLPPILFFDWLGSSPLRFLLLPFGWLFHFLPPCLHPIRDRLVL